LYLQYFQLHYFAICVRLNGHVILKIRLCMLTSPGWVIVVTSSEHLGPYTYFNRHILLRCLYQNRKVSGHVYVC